MEEADNRKVNVDDTTIESNQRAACRRGQPIHIRPMPGQRVTLDGKVEVKHGARHLRVWELEITVSETATWNRRVTAGGLKVDGPADFPQGGLNILGGADSKFIHLVIHDNANRGNIIARGRRCVVAVAPLA